MSGVLLVADSGPLIALARLDCLGIPTRYFESVIVTSTVWDEVTRKPRDSETSRLIEERDANLFRVQTDPQNIPDDLVVKRIDAGERSTIALALQLNASVLIDERRGRLIAKEFGRPVLGTFALLVNARQDGHIPALRPLLQQLLATNYYLPHDAIYKVLAGLGE